MSQIMPPSAIEWDQFFNLAAIIALAALCMVVAAMVYFSFKFRERKGQQPYVPEKRLSKTRATHVVIFAVISIIILVGVAVAGDRLTPNARFRPPASEDFVVQVTSFQWSFRFQYPNGAISQGYLNLPSNTTVMFNVTTLDVMHNFYLVQYKVSIDSIPGRSNYIWITTPNVSGNSTLDYDIVCKELCGTGHEFMHVPMTVMSQASFNQWLGSQTTAANSTATGGG
jgi:cytochrome c oxidase subunit 2